MCHLYRWDTFCMGVISKIVELRRLKRNKCISKEEFTMLERPLIRTLNTYRLIVK